MPYVNVGITNEGALGAQKAEIIEGITSLMVEILDKNPATTVVIIDEVELVDWGMGGLSVADYRTKKD